MNMTEINRFNLTKIFRVTCKALDPGRGILFKFGFNLTGSE